MEEIISVIEKLFSNNKLIIIILFSLSWIFLYVFLKLLGKTLVFSYIRIPLFVNVFFWRLFIIFPTALLIIIGILPDQINLSNKIMILNKKISQISNHIKTNKKNYNRFFMIKDVNNNISNIEKLEVFKLNNDINLFEAFSKDSELAERGTLNICYKKMNSFIKQRIISTLSLKYNDQKNSILDYYLKNKSEK
jgi:hypothetical protein